MCKKSATFTTILRLKKCHFYYDMQKTSFYLLFYKIATHHVIEVIFWMKIVMQSTRDDIDK
jgi:hypothetical protein